jgi:hypothetical protein
MEFKHVHLQEARCLSTCPCEFGTETFGFPTCVRGVIENYYASVKLANKNFDHDTHPLGTLHTNRKGNPCESYQHKIEKWLLDSNEKQ